MTVAMSLPSALSLGTSVHRWTSNASTPAVPDRAAGESFAALAEGLRGEGSETITGQRGHRHLPGYGRVETVKVKESHIGHDGKSVDTVKELAVCPECGTANCACLSRVTLQSRLDEENASGVRGEEKPQPFAMLPQSFNQISISFSSGAQAGSGPRMFG